MSKTIKRTLSLFLVLLIAGSGLGVLSANAVTAYEILDKLAVLDANGSTWGSYGNLKPGSSFTNGQCWQYVKGVSSYVYGTTVSIPNTASYLGGGSLGEYYRVRAALTNCTYDQIVELLKLSQPGDVIGFKNSKVDATYGHIMFIGNNTGKKITFYQAASGKARKDTVDLTVAGLKSLYSFGYSGGASFASSSYGISLFRCNRRTGQSEWVYTDEPTTPPGPVTDLHCDKSLYNTSESITFYWSPVSGATEYWVYLWKDGNQLYEYNCGNSTSFTQVPSGEGNYHLCIRPRNSKGFNENSSPCYFTVSNSIPGSITDLHSEKKIYNTGESIHFSWSPATNATEYRVYLWKDNDQLFEYNCGGNTSFTQAPSAEGEYHLCIRPKNDNGYNEASSPYYFTITNSVPNAVTDLHTEKYIYGTQENVVFSWSPAKNAEEYLVYLWKDGQQLYEYNCGSNTTFTQAPSTEGDYHLCIRPRNINGCNEASSSCYYIVRDPVQLDYNANGGEGEPASEIGYGTITLSTEQPTRSGYSFLGWATSATVAAAQYSAGASYNLTQNITLYAVWQKNEVTLQSISVKTNPTQTTYTVGETLNTAGLTLTAAYSDGSTQTVTSGFTCNPTKLDTAGFRTITVTYNGKTATFGVTVNPVPATLTGIAVKTPPAQTTYTVGDTLNTAGLTLTAAYSDGSTQTVTSGFTCTPTKLNTAGQQTITVTYGGKTASFVVTVNSAAPTQGRVRAVSVSDVSLNYKAKTTLKPQITADEGVKYTVSYSSSNPNVVKVNEKTGEVTGAKKGSATVTCAVTDEFGNTVSDACKVTVNYTALQWVIIILLFGWIWYK
ncbi:MAG: bacterial Ig-like domain-containing protein [Clostridia bacterium]|nr:bacterial Ig-like domain-containing protein [Clostridia bacterium]